MSKTDDDEGILNGCRDISNEKNKKTFAIATLVTDFDTYSKAISSFRSNGFDLKECEYIFINNIDGNAFTAYRGINKLVKFSNADYIIVCHQDILVQESKDALEAKLNELTEIDKSWAVAGNAGGIRFGRLAMRITDPRYNNVTIGDLPCKVRSLDENFLVLRSECGLSLSGDLSGFHLYGTDICIIAEILGYSCYVIDYHVKHLSSGNPDEKFYKERHYFIDKWNTALRPRAIQTTCTYLIVGNRLLNNWFDRNILRNAVRAFYKLTGLTFPINGN